MKMLLRFLALLSIFYLPTRCFNYENEGPEFWSINDPQCGGERQSPIDIKDSEANYDPDLKQFNFINYDANLRWICRHNGHTIILHPRHTQQNGLIFSGSNFNESFYLVQIHFHWGKNNDEGSEHYINGNSYPLEMHLVHKSKSGAIAVLGFLFTTSFDDVDNPLLEDLLNEISNVYNSSTTNEFYLKMNEIIPSLSNLTNYYRYIGSLTTPPCTEGLVWTVFRTPILISTRQLNIFHKNSVHMNFRPPQKLYKRNVYSSSEFYFETI